MIPSHFFMLMLAVLSHLAVMAADAQGGGHRPLCSDAGCDVDPYISRLVDREAAIVPRVHPMAANESAAESVDGPLTRDQIQRFNEQGFLVLRRVFSADELAPHINELDRLLGHYASHVRPNEGVLVEDNLVFISEPNNTVVKSVFDVHVANAKLRKLCWHDRLVRRARQLLADDVYLHQCRANFQQPFVGKGFNWHSDFETWHSEDGMPTPRAVSCAIMLDDNHEYNGALMVIPGSHKHYVQVPGRQGSGNWRKSLRNQVYGVPPPSSLRTLALQAQASWGEAIRYCTGRVGDVIFFDSNLMHGSHNNISPFSRRNLFQVFNAVSNQLQQPFAAGNPRPEYIAHRKKEHCRPIPVSSTDSTDE